MQARLKYMADQIKSIDPVYEYIGSRLRSFRLERGLKQKTVADQINVSVAQYCKYEDGSTKCSITALYKLADFFNIDISSLIPIALDEEEAMKRENVEMSNITNFPQINNKADPVNENPLTELSEADLLAKLISSFMDLPSRESREKLVAFLSTI